MDLLKEALIRNSCSFNLPIEEIEKSMKWAKANSMSAMKCTALFRKHFKNMPEYMFFQGNPGILKKKRIAIVGTRKPDAYGREMARKIVKAVNPSEYSTVSGFALGVDSIVHSESLKNRIDTIAVPGAGLAVNYPAMNSSLRKEIINRGLLLNEMLPYSRARTYYFLRRNMIIAAMSDIVIIIQGSEKSGTLSTMNAGVSLGREVYALPGNINNPLSYVPNLAITSGASILNDLKKHFMRDNHMKTEISPEERLFLQQAEQSNRIDEIIANLPFEKDRIMSIITRLEIKGIIKRDFNNTIIIMEEIDGQPDT